MHVPSALRPLASPSAPRPPAQMLVPRILSNGAHHHSSVVCLDLTLTKLCALGLGLPARLLAWLIGCLDVAVRLALAAHTHLHLCLVTIRGAWSSCSHTAQLNAWLLREPQAALCRVSAAIHGLPAASRH